LNNLDVSKSGKVNEKPNEIDDKIKVVGKATSDLAEKKENFYLLWIKILRRLNNF